MILSPLILLIFSPLSAYATQIFSNSGTLSGWAYVHEEHSGSVQEVTNINYQGPTALKMTQIYDANYGGRYHSEVRMTNVYRRGDVGFYGFMFRLQESWQFSPAQSYNLAQFIADFSGECEEDWMPSSMIWLVGDKLYSRVKTGNVCPKSAQITNTFANLATVTPGVWHKIVIQSSWKSDNTGYYKLWFDGQKVLERFNIPTTVAKDNAFEFRVGLYANGWYDDGEMKGTQGTRQVWYDEIAAGATFADADPDQW
ncbi:polysaccharide lyase family 20 protein [Patellaria atrata CBS 101060]|uniref:Polysaccharide lyase family 20 protein n=1 Tax=Patellaria atrata CBS 101060 TaxID=1346257 RepID=A0A9P4S679_9PEZI|nr:polysaccharide lyase family 20 protein [Patellaria atrata CBS 101060]